MDVTNFDKVDVLTADERGRVTLGPEFANEQVWVAAVHTPGPDDLEEPTMFEKRVLSKMAGWAIENGIEAADYRPREGVVISTDGEKHETPYHYPRSENQHE